MKIDLHKITIRKLTEDYVSDETLGVSAYGGKLNIRPPYQREFVYKNEQRDRVIESVLKSRPLNVMYWSKNDLHSAAVPDQFAYEVLDGQQRSISLCEYVKGTFSVEGFAFHNLPEDTQAAFLDHELMVYFCEGTESERLDWFEIINIAGVQLTAQELRNAVYTGPWLSSAKKFFSKVQGPAHFLGGNYMNGSANRQEFLERAIDWASPDGKIRDYMNGHRRDEDAQALWDHFEKVILWVQRVFPTYRGIMKGLPWGRLHGTYEDLVVDPVVLEARIKVLLLDDEVTSKKGIYEYLLSGQPKHLSLRLFADHVKEEARLAQGKKCAGYTSANYHCANPTKLFDLDEMEGDHKVPWSRGGKTTADNCRMLCIACNREKSNS